MDNAAVTIEQARAKLGDLVLAAMNGKATTITRYGKPVAVITAYVPDATTRSTTMSADEITVTLNRPADIFGSDWNWAEAATEQWIAAAEAAGLTVGVLSTEVVHPESEAALIEVSGVRYVIEVRNGDDVHAVAI